MRAASSFIAFFLSLAAVAPLGGAVDVASCSEFEAVDRKTETEVTITTADFACDEYTRLSIRSSMVLKSSVGAVTFSNLGLKVYGSLTVEPDVVFTGITLADKSGAALALELGAVAVFQGTANFENISVQPRNEGARIYRKGAAISSQGSLTFEKDATFTGCTNEAQDGEAYDEAGEILYDASSGGGGAVYQRAKGTMHFMGKLTMTNNEADSYFDANRGEGGAFYNKGDVVVDGEATFSENIGQEGGAIFQTTWGTFTFNGFATFEKNTAWNQRGGAIANYGGEMTFTAGTSFDDNTANSTGDGGLGGGIFNYNGGVVTLDGPNSFTNNWAYGGGAIYNMVNPDYTFEAYGEGDYVAPILAYPDDTIFEGNEAENCPDVGYSFEDCRSA